MPLPRCIICNEETERISVVEDNQMWYNWFCSWQHLLEYVISKVSSPDTSSDVVTTKFTADSN